MNLVVPHYQAPQNLDAEQVLLGAIMANNEVYNKVATFLRPEHFADPLHGRIYTAAGKLIGAGRRVDPVTLKNLFDQDGALVDIGGAKYLVELAKLVITVTDAEDYGVVIVEMAKRRRLIEIAGRASREAQIIDVGVEFDSFLAKFEGEVAEIATNGARRQQLRPHRFPLISFDQIQPNISGAYLVKGWIPREGLVVVYGPPKCGKSFLAFDLGMHIALGLDYRDNRVKQAPVVYVAAEGQSGQGGRVQAWRQHHGHTGTAPFYLVPNRLDLVAEGGTLIADIEAQLGDVVPGAVFLDTLNRTMSGSERDDGDMAAYIKAADTIKTAFNCAVIIIHHSGIEAGRPRGHTSLAGAADAQIQVKRDAAGIITATVEFMKDGAEGLEVHSRLQVIDVGTDEDGERLTSCVITASDEAAAPKSRLSDGQGLAIAQLQNAVIDIGQHRVGKDFPPGIRVVPVEEWRGRCESAGILSRDNAETSRKQWQRLRQNLQNKGAIRIWDDFVWLTGQPGQ